MDFPFQIHKKGPLFILKMQANSRQASLILGNRIQNSETPWFWWPNHEGERGQLAEVYEKLGSLEGVTRGLSILYPTTAFCRSIIVGDKEGGVILCALPEKEGQTARITARCRGRKQVEFVIKTGSSSWILGQFKGGPEKALELLDKIMKKIQTTALPAPEPSGKFLLKTGLISPNYKCDVPPEKGFLILEDIARLMKKHLGPENWLHVFGYSHGHDILYPDYTPSHYLGGKEKLRAAIQAVHSHDQKLSFHMNIRMADERQVKTNFDLQKAVFLDPLKKKVIKNLGRQDFVVMDTENPLWQNRIIKEARGLADLGIDALELSHKGLPPGLLPIGALWGTGTSRIMTEIKNMGVKIWYQGGADIYPADWLELSREEPGKDAEAHILSGCFLGSFDPRLFMTVAPGRAYLASISRNPFPLTDKTLAMKNLEPVFGGLFLYNKDYLNEAEMIMKRGAREESLPNP